MTLKIKLLLVILCSCLEAINAQDIKSYMQMEVITPVKGEAPISNCDPTAGLWAEWSNEDTCILLMDGTKWKYSRTDTDGNEYYKYNGSDMSTEPGVSYKELKVIPDKTKLKIRYIFSFMGYSMEMIATYGYIGEGAQPAIDYVTRGQSDFSYSTGRDKYRKFEKTRNKCSKCSGCSGYWGYKHDNGTYEGACSNTDGHGHTCGHGPEKHGLKKW